jgi:hypothetical protein
MINMVLIVHANHEDRAISLISILVTQGGDWGFTVLRFVGMKYPDHCLASHFNYVWADPPRLLKSPWQYLLNLLPCTAQEKAGLERTRWFREDGYGYNTEQSTCPHTVGYGLEDSPVALLAWIYEKLHNWTDGYPWTDDEILTWVCVYLYSTAGLAASARIYYETMHPFLSDVTAYNPRVKLGLSTFPQDLLVLPRAYRRTLGHVVFDRVHESGGHFAAHERPEMLVGDLRDMFAKNGGASSVLRMFSKNA